MKRTFLLLLCFLLGLLGIAHANNETDNTSHQNSVEDREVTGEVEEHLVKFSQWILDNQGIHFLSSEPIPSRYGKLVSIPRRVAITESVILESPEIGQILKNSEEHIVGRSRLAVFLLHERKKGAASFWAPYFELLPEELDTPIFWTEEQQAALKGSWILDRVYEDYLLLQNDYAQVFTNYLFVSHSDVFPKENYTFEDYVWAWSIIWSRSFHFENTESALVPVADIFNHKNDAKSDLEYDQDSDTYQFKVRDNYKAGDQIWNNYTPRPNNELLRLYGFILPNNNENVAFMETGLSEDDPNFALKEEMLSAHELWSHPYPYSDIPNGLFLSKKGIPDHVMAALRIKFWSPSNFQKKQFEKDGKLPKINPKKQISAENEKKVLEHIMDVCIDHLNRYPHSYTEDEKLLEDATLDRRTRMAILVRLEEKNIYNKIRSWILSQDHRAKSGEEFDSTIL